MQEKILSIDAEPDIRALRTPVLTQEGEVVLTAADRGRPADGRLHDALTGSATARDELEGLRQTLQETQAALQAAEARLQGELTAHKQTAEQLLYLQRAIETIPIGIIVIDLDGRIISANSAAAAMHGYHAEELLQHNVSMLAPESRTRVGPESILEWQGLLRESVHIRKDGSRFPVSLMSEIIQDADGEPLALVTSCEDITCRKQVEDKLEQHWRHLVDLVTQQTAELQNEVAEHKRAETALRESEERFRTLFEHSPDAIFVEGINGIVLDVNPAACRLQGMEAAELIGKHVLDLTPPDLREQIAQKFALQMAGQQARLDSFTWTKDGSVVPVELNISTMVYTGQPALLVHARDITERTRTETWLRSMNEQLEDEILERQLVEESLKESEARFKNMFEGHNAVMLLIDPETGMILDGNRAAEHFYGYPKAQLCAMTINAINLSSAAQIELERQKACAEERNYVIFPHRVVNGETRIVEMHSSLIHYREKHVLFAIIHDITDRKHAEENLTRAYQELKETQVQLIQSAKLASIGQLAAGVAHELNQPLMVIRTTAQFLRRSLEKGTLHVEHMQEHFEPIDRNTKRMMRIINHLRAFSRQSQGELVLLDVNQVIESSFLMIGEQLRLHNITVQQDLSPGLRKIRGDANQLEQVVLNLLTNARDAIAAKGGGQPGTIAISTRASSDQSEWIEILVRDSGLGIAADYLKKIFDPFFTTKAVGKGTGLGLSISYGIIHEHQGEIAVTDTGPEGTTFRVTLPVEQRTTPQDQS